MADSMMAQSKPTDSIQKPTFELEEVMVAALRVDANSPVTFSNLSKKELSQRNLGQDIPILMKYLPGVVTTSDAGAGIGYTGIRVRGSDATRVNVTLNGIPLNDAESHGVWWVNMPDFASSTESLQLQRGVGTSTNGSGAFGASLNLLTDAVATLPGVELSNSLGSFNTLKSTLKFTTGLLNNRIEFAGRLSSIQSDGYIDRATSDLESFFLQASYLDDNTLIKALAFGGHEVTYQSWNGIEDKQTLSTHRTYNSAGKYTDENDNVQFYDNEVDNYKQDHFQLHWNQKWDASLSTNIALHYTHGRGFYEQYKEDQSFSEYNLTPIIVGSTTLNTTDLIRRKWLKNDFYGTTVSINYKKSFVDWTLGSSLNTYEGGHFGEVIWARNAGNSEIRNRYYDNFGNKKEANVFSKLEIQLTSQWLGYLDLQYRSVNYEADALFEGNKVDATFEFFNPKAGLTFRHNNNHYFYTSYARAQREPNRTDYENGTPLPEILDDFELGWRFQSGSSRVNTNLYYMKYQDQLVLTGAIDDVGAPIRANVGDSYRLGLEIDALIALTDKWVIHPTVSLSKNKNKDYIFKRNGKLETLGDTHIAYSPEVVVSNAIQYQPSDRLQLSLLTKYVGEQYLGNLDSQNSLLEAYAISDLSVQYQWNFSSVIDSLELNLLINNIFDVSYISNGYFYTYDDDWTQPGEVKTIEGTGYYPQAGIHFLLGVRLKI